MAGYLSEDSGFIRWQAEFAGFEPPANSGSGGDGNLRLICWFEGEFTAPEDGFDVDERLMRFLVVQARLGSASQASVIASSRKPMAVLAPNEPDPAARGGRPSGTPTQPEGVRVTSG